MRWLALASAALLAGCVTQTPTPAPAPAGPPLPPMPTNTVVRKAMAAKSAAPKTASVTSAALVQVKTMTLPNGDPPLFHVNYGPNYAGPMIAGVDGTNMVLIVPAGTPMLYVPNKTAAPFAKLQSSPDLTTWTTLGYMTNFVNGFYMADVTSTNQPKYFYRLIPQ